MQKVYLIVIVNSNLYSNAALTPYLQLYRPVLVSHYLFRFRNSSLNTSQNFPRSLASTISISDVIRETYRSSPSQESWSFPPLPSIISLVPLVVVILPLSRRTGFSAFEPVCVCVQQACWIQVTESANISSTSVKFIRIHIDDLQEGYAESLPAWPSTSSAHSQSAKEVLCNE